MIKIIENKIDSLEKLSFDELMYLYEVLELSELSALSHRVRAKINGNKVFYIKNFHIEPSNICVHRCEFCSFRRESSSDEGAWSMSIDQVKEYCLEKYSPGTSEVHIVGSVHPEKDFGYYNQIVKTVRETLPSEVSIKAYSAIEILDMAASCNKEIDHDYSLENIRYVLSELKGSGLKAIPGGGAEILDDKIREKICPDKPMSEHWLNVHREAHKMGISSNATMLFGHIETREDRVRHLLRIRDLQEETSGFNAFIPLKYHLDNNIAAEKYGIAEISDMEILRTFAISRLALNNIPHIKAYWPMLGIELTELSLLFGADDIDGTINDSTKIYSLAGACEQSPQMTVSQLEKIAESAGFTAIKRK